MFDNVYGCGLTNRATRNVSSFGVIQFLTDLRPWPNDQTLLVNNLKFAYQAIFGHLATQQNNTKKLIT